MKSEHYSVLISGAIAGRGSFTESVWPFHIIDLNCTGGERAVWECPRNNLQSVYTCSSSNDASVICQGMHACILIMMCYYYNYICTVAIGTMSSNCSDGDVRLVDGSVDYEGRVEVCVNRVWGTVCSTTSRYYYYSNWNLIDAKVVCRQLGHQELGIIDYVSGCLFRH